MSTRERAMISPELRPVVDDEGPHLAFGETLDLADKHALSVYDAAYLELALRKSLPLASRDRALNKAARRWREDYAGLAQTSRFRTSSAFSSMNLRRLSTSSPISVEKIASVSARSCRSTFKSVRVSAFMVVDHSCSAFISPRPL